jgi:nucleoside-diphosphate-sugar epimerase
MTTLVTGANGFVGSALCAQLSERGIPPRAAYRSLVQSGVEDTIAVGSVSAVTDWSAALRGMREVVHLAARVHVMNETSANPLSDFRVVNVMGTENLARQAVAAGVKRLVYLSSVKVNGEFTEIGRAFTSTDTPAPQDAYGLSKYEAEERLRNVANETGLEVVIIRPPLVYGPGVKANFESMMRWLSRGVPLPLASVTANRRSFISSDNLIDLIVTCISHPAAAGQTFMASDDEDLSTAELLTRMGKALGSTARLFPAPLSLLKSGASVLGKSAIYQRLCGSLQVDITTTKQLLGWKPPISVDVGLRRAADGFGR